MPRFHQSMPVGRIRAFRSKQCPFWVNFGYVVPEIKYAPKLVELISNNGYGMVMAYISWNQEERWRRKSLISTANMGEYQLLDTTGKKSGCLVSLAFIFLAFHISCACFVSCLVALWLEASHDSLLYWLGCLFASVIVLREMNMLVCLPT